MTEGNEPTCTNCSKSILYRPACAQCRPALPCGPLGVFCIRREVDRGSRRASCQEASRVVPRLRTRRGPDTGQGGVGTSKRSHSIGPARIAYRSVRPQTSGPSLATTESLAVACGEVGGSPVHLDHLPALAISSTSKPARNAKPCRPCAKQRGTGAVTPARCSGWYRSRADVSRIRRALLATHARDLR